MKNQETISKLKNLELHQRFSVSNRIEYLRVPGGYVLNQYNISTSPGTEQKLFQRTSLQTSIFIHESELE